MATPKRDRTVPRSRRAAGKQRTPAPAPSVMPAPQLIAMPGGTAALRSTLLLLGVFALATGVASGLLRTAELVGQDVALTPSVTHREGGRVAGATTDVPGPVAFAVDDGEKMQLFSVDVPGATSVYNLLRLVQRSTTVRLEVAEAPGGPVITAVNDQRAEAGERWVVDADGVQNVAVDAVLVSAGSTVTVRLTR